MGALSDSVGVSGRNLKQDVSRVQMLLKTAGYDPGPVDGVCGRETVTAIRNFQAVFLPHPDCLIEPDKESWKRLAEAQQRAVGEEL